MQSGVDPGRMLLSPCRRTHAVPQPQEEDLSQRIQDLERSRRRWKSLTLSLLALVAVFLVAGVGLGLVQAARVRAERDRAVEAEMLAREKMRQAEVERDRAEQ